MGKCGPLSEGFSNVDDALCDVPAEGVDLAGEAIFGSGEGADGCY